MNKLSWLIVLMLLLTPVLAIEEDACGLQGTPTLIMTQYVAQYEAVVSYPAVNNFPLYTVLPDAPDGFTWVDTPTIVFINEFRVYMGLRYTHMQGDGIVVFELVQGEIGRVQSFDAFNNNRPQMICMVILQQPDISRNG